MTSARPSTTVSGTTTGPIAPASETVYAALARWALRASHGRLTSWAVGGGVDAIGLALFVPPVWRPLALPFGCLSCIGIWGLATRASADGEPADAARRVRRRALRWVRVAAVALGTLFAIATFYVVMWMIFGTKWGPSGG
jgi:hypothetical protein